MGNLRCLQAVVAEFTIALDGGGQDRVGQRNEL
jgi:hypothetical protein